MTVRLFQELGFVINGDKSQLNPMQRVKYLGFQIDSTDMTTYLGQEKQQQVRDRVSALLRTSTPTIRQVARVVGTLVAVFPAVKKGPFCYRHLEKEKSEAVKSQGSFKGLMTLSDLAREELKWWRDNLASAHGRPIRPPPVDIILVSDASTEGWGAHLLEENGNQGQRTAGRWSPEEQEDHINILELRAAWFGIQSLLAHHTGCHIQLRMDNSSAVAYVNRLGGCHSQRLDDLASTMWHWAWSKDNHLSAVHIPGVSNTLADTLSRRFQDRLEWKLDPRLFQRLCGELLRIILLMAIVKQYVVSSIVLMALI